MVSLIPRDQIAGIGHSVVLNFAFTYGMIALFALFIAYKLSESIADRIIGVALQMETIRKGRPEPLELTAAGNDEIGVLSGTYNYMTAEINQLMDYEEKAATELRIAEFRALQAQINPHFLFNTLNMIACTAKLEDAVDTEKMILSLGNLFRYNLKTREQTVTLDRELKIVNDYMYLQKMRFGSRIKYRLSLETDAADVIIPSLSLQPLVENAVVHGLSKKETGGILHIRIWKKDRMLILSVADTGLGMSQERCEEVAAAMKEHRTAKIGIGLGNIYKRVHMMYQKGDLRIYSREGKGTVIQLMIPQGEETQGEEVYVPTADRR